jgi:hypothetical protein
MMRQAFGKESTSRALKAQEHSHYFLWRHKEFVLAGQTVNSSYYCEVSRRLCGNVRRFLPELWWRKNWLSYHDNAPSHTSSFTREFFLPRTTWLSSPTHPIFLFPRFEIKLKGRHFDTTEVAEAESQTVLNTLTEQDFQVAFKKWQKRWERCIRAEGDYFEGDGQ